MPNLRTTKATSRIRTAWTKRERSRFIRSLERHQERDQVHVVLRGQGLTEHGRHHTLGESGHGAGAGRIEDRSEEHTSELQSQSNLVCRLLLEKKKIIASST